MKKLFLTSIFLFTFMGTQIIAQNGRAKFSQKEVLEDIDFLYQSLIDAHYNINAYVGAEAFKKNYEDVKKAINKDSLSLLEATNWLQKVIAAANNGHTEIDFPGASYGKYAYSGGSVFPLEIAFENNKSLIRKNFSLNPNLKVGMEILSINGLSMKEILERIYDQVSAERNYFKNAKIEMYSFPRFYWQVFGKQDVFEVDIRSGDQLTTCTLSAVNLIEGFETKRKEVLNAQRKLSFFEKAAYLNPGDLSGDEKKYQKFIDSSFSQIKVRNTSNLIVDLRNNKGGNNSFSDYLVAYFADKPFKWASNFTLKTSKFLKEHTRKYSDTSQTYFKEILSHKNGESYAPDLDLEQPQEVSKRFTGKVYVLVNRQSHSQAAVTAAQIQDYGFGTIVGEETAEYPSLYASQFQYQLPNTGIPVKVSKGYIVRVNGSTKQEGVIPDIPIRDHLLDEKDEILDGLLARLN